jgi:hypothetical protein
VSKLIKDLLNPIYDMKKFEATRQELAKHIQPFGDVIHSVIMAFTPKTAELFENLIVFADEMDKTGRSDIADKIDEIIKTANIEEIINLADYLDKSNDCRTASAIDNIIVKYADYAYIPKVRQTKCPENEATKDPLIQPTNEGTLSTRYCPDHIGAQAIRIAEHIYQCPLDGKIYNYDTGYVNYQGQKVLGGSVKEQTPPTADWGGIPMRIYDSRQNIINKTY